MGKKLDAVMGGIELLTAIGVSTLVGGALTMVKPSNLGAVKKIAVGCGGVAISSMAVDGVLGYVDKSFNEIKKVIKKAKEDIEENKTARRSPIMDIKEEAAE